MSKKKIILLRDDFVSPLIGNPYIGKVCPVTKAQAQEFIKLGYAEYYNGEGAAVNTDPDAEKEQAKDAAEESLDNKTVKVLKVLANDLEIDLPRKLSKSDLIKLIEDKTTELAELAEAEQNPDADEEEGGVVVK